VAATYRTHLPAVLCLQDAPQRIPQTSCRAGAVVHLLAANGTKLPVTLKMNTKEDPASGHLTHIVQVCGAPSCCLLVLQDLSHTGLHTVTVICSTRHHGFPWAPADWKRHTYICSAGWVIACLCALLLARLSAGQQGK